MNFRNVIVMPLNGRNAFARSGWDRQFAALSPEDQQFVTENPTSLCAEHLTECVEDALDRNAAPAENYQASG